MFDVTRLPKSKNIRVIPKNSIPRYGHFGLIPKMNLSFVKKLAEIKKKKSRSLRRSTAKNSAKYVQLVVVVFVEDTEAEQCLVMNRGEYVSAIVATHMTADEIMYKQSAVRALNTKLEIIGNVDPEFVGYIYNEEFYGKNSRLAIVFRAEIDKKNLIGRKDSEIKCLRWTSKNENILGLDSWSQMLFDDFSKSKPKEHF